MPKSQTFEGEESGCDSLRVVTGYSQEGPPQRHVLDLEGEGDFGQQQFPHHFEDGFLDEDHQVPFGEGLSRSQVGVVKKQVSVLKPNHAIGG